MQRRTLGKAKSIESNLYETMRDAMKRLDDIHCWGPENLDRDALWELRARVQDAIRAMCDEAPLRKDLPFIRD